MTRVSTFGQNTMAISQMMQIQSNLSEANVQAASELKSNSYADLSSDAHVLKQLEASLDESYKTVENTEQVASRVDTMYDAVGNMIEILANYQVTLSAAMSGEAAEAAALNEYADAQMDSFVTQVNLQVSGRYLFAGSRTDTPPVDLSGYADQSYPSSQSFDYYQGDDQELAFYGSGDSKITYGITGDESGIEKAIRAFSLGANASENPMDEDALIEAYDLVNEALDEIILLQSELSMTATKLENEIDREIDYQLKIDSMIGDIQNVDLAAVITEQKQLQVLLEASYNVTSSINSLSLFEYL